MSRLRDSNHPHIYPPRDWLEFSLNLWTALNHTKVLRFSVLCQRGDRVACTRIMAKGSGIAHHALPHGLVIDFNNASIPDKDNHRIGSSWNPDLPRQTPMRTITLAQEN